MLRSMVDAIFFSKQTSWVLFLRFPRHESKCESLAGGSKICAHLCCYVMVCSINRGINKGQFAQCITEY